MFELSKEDEDNFENYLDILCSDISVNKVDLYISDTDKLINKQKNPFNECEDQTQYYFNYIGVSLPMNKSNTNDFLICKILNNTVARISTCEKNMNSFNKSNIECLKKYISEKYNVLCKNLEIPFGNILTLVDNKMLEYNDELIKNSTNNKELKSKIDKLTNDNKELKSKIEELTNDNKELKIKIYNFSTNIEDLKTLFNVKLESNYNTYINVDNKGKRNYLETILLKNNSINKNKKRKRR